jgi:hypothetical protein
VSQRPRPVERLGIEERPKMSAAQATTGTQAESWFLVGTDR